MCSASHYVMLVELLVEGDGLREALDGVRYALLEPSTPQFGLLGLGLGLGLGLHGDPMRRRECATELSSSYGKKGGVVVGK